MSLLQKVVLSCDSTAGPTAEYLFMKENQAKGTFSSVSVFSRSSIHTIQSAQIEVDDGPYVCKVKVNGIESDASNEYIIRSKHALT